MDQTAKQSIIDRLQQANNVLVTVKSSPSVDQLAACIGFTLFLNKIGKHATAVFSGKVPSTLEFLKPAETIEKNTDSLRDFIIALDKSKADKLRYKVEDKVVKIFITPYKTSLTQKDLEFSQGDFNVDVVVALGVQSKSDIDNAITAHGRILHDATVIAINNGVGSNVATLNLEDAGASSLSEILVDLSEAMQPDSFDAQMATAYLTGIVSETKRFSNEKTSARTMSLSAKLMAAGANQQLIATKLQPSMVAGGDKLKVAPKTVPDTSTDQDGTLHIEHEEKKKIDSNQTLAEIEKEVVQEEQTGPELPPVKEEQAQPQVPDVPTTQIGDVKGVGESQQGTAPIAGEPKIQVHPDTNMAYEPPTMGGTLTANSRPQDLEPAIDPLGQRSGGQTLEHTRSSLGAAPQTGQGQASPKLDAARQAVEQAASQGTQDRFEPLAAVGSQPFDMDVQGTKTPAQQPPIPPATPMAPNTLPPATGQPMSVGGVGPINNVPSPASVPPALPQQLPRQPLVPPDAGLPPEQTAAGASPTAPPPVPPPMMPPS